VCDQLPVAIRSRRPAARCARRGPASAPPLSLGRPARRTPAPPLSHR
jgi:hypothetical protein